MATAFLGLGSNLGEKAENLRKAVGLLRREGIVVRKQSSLYETEPWGDPNQPLFLNMAIEIETGLEPAALLGVLQRIEAEMGRERTRRWGPRVIDLDILFYNHIILNENGLTIPHPLLHEREFVLKPLFEIAPDVVHPSLGTSVRELFFGLIRKSTANHGIS